jgi:hypothetical protein
VPFAGARRIWDRGRLPEGAVSYQTPGTSLDLTFRM